MTQVDRSIEAQASPTLAPVVSRRADIMMLAKPGIVKLVVVTSAVGFALAALGGGLTLAEAPALVLAALWCLVGTALSAAGANALNQAMEWSRDASMQRTMRRPVAAGRMSVMEGVLLGSLMALAGVAVLWMGNNAVAALVSVATVLTYVFLYTPMKPLSPAALWVGAVPGAAPPLIGWAAASEGAWRGLDQPGGWAIFVLMFAWQVPHFLALAWKYREDYARGGFRVLSISDRTGLKTGWHSLFWTLLMIGASLVPMWAMRGSLGWPYLVVATLGGVFMLWLAVNLLAERSDLSAKRLFLGSIAYLPIVLAAMVADAALVLVS